MARRSRSGSGSGPSPKARASMRSARPVCHMAAVRRATRKPSSAPCGASSLSRLPARAAKSASSSRSSSRWTRAVRPWRSALRDARALPRSLTGPRECLPLRRARSARSAAGSVGNGIGSAMGSAEPFGGLRHGMTLEMLNGSVSSPPAECNPQRRNEPSQPIEKTRDPIGAEGSATVPPSAVPGAWERLWGLAPPEPSLKLHRRLKQCRNSLQQPWRH